MRGTARKYAALLAGSAAALAPLATTPAALAAANPGQPVLNDYGQSPAEVAAEITAAVNATPAVVNARKALAAAHARLQAYLKAEAKAHQAYLAAVKSKNRARIAATKKADSAAHARTVKARAAENAAKAALAKIVAKTTAAIKAAHYTPVDGVWTGDVAQYFIPGIGLEPIQVQITLYGGHVSNVVTTLYTNTGDSAAYNAMALPILEQEAMAAHDTANVANVSGASLTSEKFAQSLQSALIKGGFKF